MQISRQVSDWAAGQFGQVERRLPWLTTYGTEIYHVCGFSGRALGFASGRVLAASPKRAEARLYGFDGPLESRLSDLFGVLADQGWLEFDEPPPTSYIPGPVRLRPAGPFNLPPPLRAQWRPKEDDLSPAGFPVKIRDAAGRLHPPGLVSLIVGWASDQRTSQPVTDLGAAPDDPGEPTRLFQVIEYRQADFAELAAAALAEHEHALTFRINVFYRGEAE